MLRVLCVLLLLTSVAPAMADVPEGGSLEVHVIGRRYLWEFDYGGGARSIGVLRLPASRRVRLQVSSADTAHRLSIPDLQVKVDADPKKPRTVWLSPREGGTHKIACLRYCGVGHVNMTAELSFVPQAEFEAWLASLRGGKADPSLDKGRELFLRLGCAACHASDGAAAPKGPAVGPQLSGIFGKKRRLQGGGEVLVDEAYLRESILSPNKKIAAGFAPVMPPFDGVLDEGRLRLLLTYLRNMK